MNGQQPVEVLIVSYPGDEHGDAVQSYLERNGRRVARTSLAEFRSADIFWNARNGYVIQWDQCALRLGPQTTIWWRRPGKMDVEDLPTDEALLIAAEGAALFEGILLSSGSRWIDHPDLVDRAEKKLFQLTVAHRLGIRTPRSIVTTKELEARLLSRSGPVVGKSVSNGPGPALFASVVPKELLGLVRHAPTFLQTAILGAADLRIVTVGEQTFAWRRARSDGQPIDWRHPDPEGRGFVRCYSSTEAAAEALRVAAGLGLTMSVQDWVELNGKAYFLEVNPQGAWLFLEGAAEEVVPALAHHLLGSPRGGYWPPAWRQLLSDFLPKALAPSQSGIRAPELERPAWIAETNATTDEVLAHARRAHDQQTRRAETAEGKGDRLAKLSLGLVALSLSFLGFHVGTLQSGELFHQTATEGSVTIAALLAIGFFAMAALNAFEIDRVGIYYQPGAEISASSRDPLREMIWIEEAGRLLARWSSDKKLDVFLQARAWFSRGIAAILIAALVWIVIGSISGNPLNR